MRKRVAAFAPRFTKRAAELAEADAGSLALAIPNNGNVSNGTMFTSTTFAGEPMNDILPVLAHRLIPGRIKGWTRDPTADPAPAD